MNNFREYRQIVNNNLSYKSLTLRVSSLLQKPFARNVFVAVSGSAMAQVINTLFSPILTRVYGPEAMGAYDTFVSVTLIVIPVAALTYQHAVVIAKEDREAKDLIYLSFIVSIILALATLIGFLFFGEAISNYFKVDALRYFLLLVPAFMVFSTVVETVNQWFIRKSRFNLTAKAGIWHALLTNGLKLIIGLLAPTAASLVVVATLGIGIHGGLVLLGAGVMSFISLKKLHIKQLDIKNKRERIFQTAKKYREFPAFRAPQTLVDAISLNMPVLMLTTLFGPAAAGFYALGFKVVHLPVNLIGDSVANVFYPRFSVAYNEGQNTRKLLVLATLALFAVGFIPFGLLIVFGPELFGLVFGQDWVSAGVYARWIGIWVFTKFISRPAIKALPVIGAQKFHLFHTVISIICKIGVMIVGAVIFESNVLAMAMYGVTGAVLNTWLILVAVYKSKTNTSAE